MTAGDDDVTTEELRDVPEAGAVVAETFNRRGELVGVVRAGDEEASAADPDDADEGDDEPDDDAPAPRPHVPGYPFLPVAQTVPPAHLTRPDPPKPAAAPLCGWIGGTQQFSVGHNRTRVLSTAVGLVGGRDEVAALASRLDEAFRAGRDGAGEKLRAAVEAAAPDTKKLDELRERLRGLEGDVKRAESTLRDARRLLREAVRAGRDDTAEQDAVSAADVALTRLQRRHKLVESDLHAEEKRVIAARAEARAKATADFKKQLRSENAAATQVLADKFAELLKDLLPELQRLRGEADWLRINR